MHHQLIFLNVINEEFPRVQESQRLSVRQSAPNVYEVALRFGFREEPDVPLALKTHAKQLPQIDPMSTSYVIARSTIIDGPGELPAWRSGLYGWMTRQAEGAAAYFKLPANQVVELGTQVLL